MNQQRCDRIELADLLQEDCNVPDQRDIEAHLEHCQTCQSRLTELAAGKELWTQVASHLSTVDQIELLLSEDHEFPSAASTLFIAIVRARN